jgi:hypothetical protein
VILSRWDWDQAVRLAPWKGVLAFLAWPVLSAQPYVYQSESDLHRLMRAAWSAAGVPVRHEVSLGQGRRIDFTSRGVGVEVKITGHPVEVRKQLQRYAASGRLQALVLFTACPGHRGEIPEHGYAVPTAGNRSVGRPVTVGPPEGAPVDRRPHVRRSGEPRAQIPSVRMTANSNSLQITLRNEMRLVDEMR